MTPDDLRTARGGTLVLGGGFAGAYVARGLGRQGATIVNPANFMLYTPLLPEAAAGSIEPRHVTVPLRTMCPHADLLLGSAVALDPDAQGRQRLLGGRRVRGRLRAAGDRARLDHAHAARARAARVLARPQGHRRRDPPAQPRAAPDRARRRRPGERAAAADVRLRRRRLRGCRSRRRAPGTDRRCAPAASASRGCPAPLGLGRLGAAHPRAGAREPRARSPRGRSAGAAWRSSPQTALASIDRGGAVLSDGRRIETETVVWTAGVAANPVAARLGLPLDARGRIPVDELFQGRGPGRRARARRHRRRAERRHRQLRPADLPARAAPGPPARRATCSGRVKPYAYKSLGSMATLGRRHGIATVGGRPPARHPRLERRARLPPAGAALPRPPRARARGLDRRGLLPPRRRGAHAMRWRRELLLFGAAYLLYNAGRGITSGQMDLALANANWVHRRPGRHRRRALGAGRVRRRSG